MTGLQVVGFQPDAVMRTYLSVRVYECASVSMRVCIVVGVCVVRKVLRAYDP